MTLVHRKFTFSLKTLNFVTAAFCLFYMILWAFFAYAASIHDDWWKVARSVAWSMFFGYVAFDKWTSRRRVTHEIS